MSQSSQLTLEELKAQLVLDTRTNPLSGKGYSYLAKLSTEGNTPETNIMRFADEPGFECSQQFRDSLNNDVLTIGLGPLKDAIWVAEVKAFICNEIDDKNITTMKEGQDRIKELFKQFREDCHAEFKGEKISSSDDVDAIKRQLTNLAIDSVFKAATDKFNKRTDTTEEQKGSLVILKNLTSETLKALKTANVDHDPKLKELAILAEKATQKARSDFIRGKNPAECAKNLATEIRAIKNKTKKSKITRAAGSLLHWTDKTQEFSDRLLNVLMKNYPQYESTQKLDIKALKAAYSDSPPSTPRTPGRRSGGG